MRALTLLVLVACGTPAHLQNSRCRKPAVWYPDANQDGVGETTSSYFGCRPPAGWITTLEGDETTASGPGGTGLGDTGQSSN
jgi:hypothetical protein